MPRFMRELAQNLSSLHDQQLLDDFHLEERAVHFAQPPLQFVSRGHYARVTLTLDVGWLVLPPVPVPPAAS